MPLMRTRSCTRLLDHGRPCLLWWRLVFQMRAPAIRDYELTHSSIKITCAPAKNVLEGILFTACPLTHAIAINTTPAPPNPSAPVFSQPGDYHIIPFAHIESFEIVGSGERASEATAGFDGALPSISKVDVAALQAREEQTIREMKKKDAQKGKGVSQEAQELFDAISRT
jgi:hypothetical protein